MKKQRSETERITAALDYVLSRNMFTEDEIRTSAHNLFELMNRDEDTARTYAEQLTSAISLQKEKRTLLRDLFLYASKAMHDSKMFTHLFLENRNMMKMFLEYSLYSWIYVNHVTIDFSNAITADHFVNILESYEKKDAVKLIEDIDSLYQHPSVMHAVLRRSESFDSIGRVLECSENDINSVLETACREEMGMTLFRILTHNDVSFEEWLLKYCHDNKEFPSADLNDYRKKRSDLLDVFTAHTDILHMFLQNPDFSGENDFSDGTLPFFVSCALLNDRRESELLRLLLSQWNAFDILACSEPDYGTKKMKLLHIREYLKKLCDYVNDDYHSYMAAFLHDVPKGIIIDLLKQFMEQASEHSASAREYKFQLKIIMKKQSSADIDSLPLSTSALTVLKDHGFTDIRQLKCMSLHDILNEFIDLSSSEIGNLMECMYER